MDDVPLTTRMRATARETEDMDLSSELHRLADRLDEAVERPDPLKTPGAFATISRRWRELTGENLI